MSLVRVANSADVEGIYYLVRDSFSTFSDYSLRQFQEIVEYIYEKNPARTDEHVFGWVIEDAGKIVGFLGLFPLYFNVRGQRVTGASGTMWCIDPDFQSYGLFLYKRYIDWGRDRLLIDSSSSHAANRIHEGAKLGMTRVSATGVGEKLYWPLDYRRAAASWLVNARCNQYLMDLAYRTARPLLEKGISVSLRLRDWVYRSSRIRSQDIALREITEFHEIEVNDLLHRTRHQTSITLLRDQDFLKWRLGVRPEKLGKTWVIGCFRESALLGYIAIRLPRDEDNRIYRVVDLFYDLRESDVAMLLLSYVRDLATQRGGAFLELKGFSSIATDSLRATAPIRTKAKVWPYWHNRYCERQDLTDGSKCWWTSGVDGDANIF